MEPQTLIYEFDDVRVDVPNMQVWKSGQRLALEPKAFRVLVFLLERAGRLVEKEELLSAIWADTFVTENALTRAIALLRKVLGDSTSQAKYIETVPTRGYRFIAAVTTSHTGTVAAIPGAAGETNNVHVPEAQESLGESGKQTSVSSMWRRPSTWISIAAVSVAVILAIWFVAQRQQQISEKSEYAPLQVTNSTGLDVYPSFSPDGNTIAYCSDENGSFEIYLRQLTRGGSVVQLTNDGGRNMQPTWSPDGATIAYYSQAKGGIWLIPALGGVARQLTTFGSSPSWSPDGTQIVFESEGIKDLGATAVVAVSTATLWIVPVKEGSPRQLTQIDRPAGAHNSPVWTPDGKSIVFLANGFKASPALWKISANGGNLEQLAQGNFFNLVFTRDGSHLYVSSEFSLWELSLTGKKDQYGAERRKILDSVPETLRYLAISPDGRKMAFSRVLTISNLYSLPMSGDHPSGPPVALTHDTRIRKTGPAVAFDGRQVLFEVGNADRNGGVWVMDADGKNSKPVLVKCASPRWLAGSEDFLCVNWVPKTGPDCKGTECWAIDILKAHLSTGIRERMLHINQDGEFLTYTRDAKQVAFMSAENGPPNTWVVSMDGGPPRQVTFDAESMGYPAWSPDGKALAVEQKRMDSTYIWLVKPGEPPVQLTHEPGQNWPASFSPDGDKIAFAANRDGVWNLWWVSRRDRSQKQLTFFQDANHHVRYPDWSPDGSFMVYEYAKTTGNIWMLDLK